VTDFWFYVLCASCLFAAGCKFAIGSYFKAKEEFVDRLVHKQKDTLNDQD
jgi:hypothetical protein